MSTSNTPPDEASTGPPSLVIDCDDCVMAATVACEDCVVTFVCGREPDEALVIDVAEERAIRLLGDEGLLPRLRHAPRERRLG